MDHLSERDVTETTHSGSIFTTEVSTGALGQRQVSPPPAVSHITQTVTAALVNYSKPDDNQSGQHAWRTDPNLEQKLSWLFEKANTAAAAEKKKEFLCSGTLPTWWRTRRSPFPSGPSL